MQLNTIISLGILGFIASYVLEGQAGINGFLFAFVFFLPTFTFLATSIIVKDLIKFYKSEVLLDHGR